MNALAHHDSSSSLPDQTPSSLHSPPTPTAADAPPAHHDAVAATPPASWADMSAATTAAVLRSTRPGTLSPRAAPGRGRTRFDDNTSSAPHKNSRATHARPRRDQPSSPRSTTDMPVTQLYRKGDVIGRGANGVVYQGMDTRTGSLVAIKEVPAQRGDASFHKLRSEVQLMSRLSHEHIVAYYGAELDQVAGVLLIFQEWVPGGSIDSLLQKFGGTFTDVVTQRYAIDVAKGLAYLHQEKIIHRDIKGGNVLVGGVCSCLPACLLALLERTHTHTPPPTHTCHHTHLHLCVCVSVCRHLPSPLLLYPLCPCSQVTDQGVAKLSDFGTSMMLADSTTAAGTKTLCGTPYYMAPEVMKGETYGRKADVWSFGGLLLQMATGSPPWKCMNFQSIPQLLIHVVTVKGPPPLDSYDISPALRTFMMRCFEFDPNLRPTVAELLEDAYLKEGDAIVERPAPLRMHSPSSEQASYSPRPSTRHVLPRRENPYARNASRASRATATSESPSNRRAPQQQQQQQHVTGDRIVPQQARASPQLLQRHDSSPSILSEHSKDSAAQRYRIQTQQQLGPSIDTDPTTPLSPPVRNADSRAPRPPTPNARGATSPHGSRSSQKLAFKAPTPRRRAQIADGPAKETLPDSKSKAARAFEPEVRVRSSREEDDAFDALVRTLPDDPNQDDDIRPSTAAASSRRRPLSRSSFDSVGKQPPTPRRDFEKHLDHLATPRRQHSAHADEETARESFSSEAADAYASTIPSNEKFFDGDAELDEDQVITIEDAYQQGLLSGKDYQKRMERVQRGDEDAGFYSVVYPR